MSGSDLRAAVERLADLASPPEAEARAVAEALLAALEAGVVRAAEPREGAWQVNAWVKRGVLLAFRTAVNVDVSVGAVFRFRDRDLLMPQTTSVRSDVRIVPGGTVVRRGAFLGDGVVVMPQPTSTWVRGSERAP